jgi:hypothetical protein
MTDARVSQLAIEVLTSRAQPDGRASQLAVETLTSRVQPDALVSQVAVETLTSRVQPDARVSQIAVEVLTSPDTTTPPDPATLTYRVSQLAVEVLTSRSQPDAQVSQVAVETLTSRAQPDARVSQIAVETLTARSQPDAQVSQVAVEVLVGRGFGLYAVIRATLSQDVSLDAVILVPSVGVTADAVIQRTQAAGFAVDGLILTPRTGAATADGYLILPASGTFSADAVVEVHWGPWSATESNSFPYTLTADAVISESVTDSFTADGITLQVKSFAQSTDAVVLREVTQQYSANSLLAWTNASAGLADAVIKATPTNSLAADASIFTPFVVETFTADAVLRAQRTSSLLARALVVQVGGPPPPPPYVPPTVTVEIFYDGQDITDYVLIETARFEAQANGIAGICQLTVRDSAQTFAPGYFKTGGGIELRIDGMRVWSGLIATVNRTYVFDVVDTTDPNSVPRYWVIEGVDWNILFAKRIAWNHSSPTSSAPTYSAGTSDKAVILDIINRFLDLDDDGIDTSGVDHVGPVSPYGEAFRPMSSQGDQWGMIMDRISAANGSIYYIDPDRVLNYRDAEKPYGSFDLSDRPGEGEEGYREVVVSTGGMDMANDVFVWGAGLGSEDLDGDGVPDPAFARVQSADSIAEYGRFQWADLVEGAYLRSTVRRRARSYVYGSPTSNRGHYEPLVEVRLTMFRPGLRVGMVVDFETEVFDDAFVTTVVPPIEVVEASLDNFAARLRRIESSNNYTAQNKVSGAYGAYQIMPGNWRVWAPKYLGTDPSKAEASRWTNGATWVPSTTRDHQDTVALTKLNHLYQFLGDWRRVAACWRSGGSVAIKQPLDWSRGTIKYVNSVCQSLGFAEVTRSTVLPPVGATDVDSSAEVQEQVGYIENRSSHIVLPVRRCSITFPVAGAARFDFVLAQVYDQALSLVDPYIFPPIEPIEPPPLVEPPSVFQYDLSRVGWVWDSSSNDIDTYYRQPTGTALPARVYERHIDMNSAVGPIGSSYRHIDLPARLSPSISIRWPFERDIADVTQASASGWFEVSHIYELPEPVGKAKLLITGYTWRDYPEEEGGPSVSGSAVFGARNLGVYYLPSVVPSNESATYPTDDYPYHDIQDLVNKNASLIAYGNGFWVADNLGDASGIWYSTDIEGPYTWVNVIGGRPRFEGGYFTRPYQAADGAIYLNYATTPSSWSTTLVKPSTGGNPGFSGAYTTAFGGGYWVVSPVSTSPTYWYASNINGPWTQGNSSSSLGEIYYAGGYWFDSVRRGTDSLTAANWTLVPVPLPINHLIGYHDGTWVATPRTTDIGAPIWYSTAPLSSWNVADYYPTGRVAGRPTYGGGYWSVGGQWAINAAGPWQDGPAYFIYGDGKWASAQTWSPVPWGFVFHPRTIDSDGQPIPSVRLGTQVAIVDTSPFRPNPIPATSKLVTIEVSLPDLPPGFLVLAHEPGVIQTYIDDPIYVARPGGSLPEWLEKWHIQEALGGGAFYLYNVAIRSGASLPPLNESPYVTWSREHGFYYTASPYVSGTLKVWLDGEPTDRYYELNPNVGSFVMFAAQLFDPLDLSARIRVSYTPQ